MQYDAKKVSVLVAGRPITGFADGSFVNVEREEDSFSDVAGSSGEVVVSANNDRRGSITITLLQTSPDVDFLFGKIAEYEASGELVFFPVMVRDQINGTVHKVSEAWVLRPADSEYGREVNSREFVLRCADLITRSERVT